MTASLFRHLSILIAAALLSAGTAAPVRAMQGEVRISAFMQAVAEAAAEDRAIAAFYRETGYRPLWTAPGEKARERRAALFRALADAPAHGLPEGRYDTTRLEAELRSVRSERDMGRLEVALSKLFLQYAGDVSTGILVPARIDPGIVRQVPKRDRTAELRAFARAAPMSYLRKLPPQSPEYARLMREKMRFERLVARGGWGPEVRARKLDPGDRGEAVVQLRNRLIAMGYLERTATAGYDDRLEAAVIRFQNDHGLAADGVAGAGTLAALNIPAEERLRHIIVAMERERWTNVPRGQRHIWVNITDYSARIVDDGKVSFETRAVVGHRDPDRRTPEFSDTMEHMILNPTWHVPRSIATEEYLPLLQRDPYAASHLYLLDRRGRFVPRDMVDFTEFDERNFPFDMKQPPSRGNALGLVKFMFPNRHNIYLHDTPQKHLFGRAARAFSHGCIRLNDPFDFAYALLARQEAEPRSFFQSVLSTGRETQVDLETHVPVHLVYRTAFTRARGSIQFRADVYGRDGRIWRALAEAGVSLLPVQG